MIVYVVTYCTESCDRGVFVFESKPTRDDLKRFFRERMPDEYEDGMCGPSWDIYTCAIEQSPDAKLLHPLEDP